MKKRLLSMILAISMVLTFLPVSAVTAFAADESSTQPMSGTCGDGLSWTLTENSNGNSNKTTYYTLSITGDESCTGKMTDWTEDTQTSIPWYAVRDEITKIIFSGNVTSIGDFAFFRTGMYQYPSVTIPASVKSIGDFAFYASGWSSVTIPNSIESIGESAFASCSHLDSIVIPSGVIGKKAFYNCSYLRAVTISDGVTAIGEHAFEQCGLNSVTIPATVTTMGEYAFLNCTGLTSVDIQNSVIGDYAFYQCSRLEKVTIPATVTTMGEYAFSWCTGLTSVDIQNSVIGDHAFYCCTKLEEAMIHSEVTTIGKYAFSHCTALTKVTMEEGVTSIDTCAFYEDALLSEMKLPDSLKRIGASAFSGCSKLTDITIPPKTTTIGQSAFAGTGPKEINIPDSVIYLGDSVFAGCTSLEKAHLPANIYGHSIPSRFFAGCSRLNTVNIPGGTKSIGAYAFSNCAALSQIDIPASVTFIAEYAFYKAGLTSITLREGLKTLLPRAFSSCTHLTTVYLPSSLESLDKGYGLFQSCNNLTTVVFNGPGNLKDLGRVTFDGCSKLNSVTLPDSLEKLGDSVFRGCTALEELTLPDKVTTIEKDAFKDCTNLKKIYYKGTLADLNKFKSGINGLTISEDNNAAIEYTGQTSIPVLYTCTVTLNPGNGTLADNQIKVYHTEKILETKANELTAMPEPTPTSSDNVFAGWYTDAATQDDTTKFNVDTPVTADMKLYAVYALNTKGVTVSASVTVKVPGEKDVISDGKTPVQVKPNTEITLEAPTKTDNGDAYEWTIIGNGSEQPETKTDDSITIPVNDETEIKLSTLKALHITEKGEPNTEGTKRVDDTYYGNGWEYSENDGLTIKETKDLSNEPAVKVAVKVEDGVTVSNARLTGDVTNNGTISNARLTGDVTSNGTLSNCVLDNAPNGTGSVENSLFGAKYTGAKTLTEADGKEITAALTGVKDGSLTGTKLWFVGAPELTATVENNTAIKHINHKAVTASTIDGLNSFTVTGDSVTFTPNGEKDILLNNRTAESGDFTFTTPDNCTYDGNVHKVDDISSTTYKDDEYTVKYDYKEPDGTQGNETEEPKDAGTYTVKIVMSDGQTITTNESFTISPAKPGKDDFDAKLPYGVTEDRDDSEKTAEVQLKSDRLFSEDNSTVTTKYQKKNANGDWEKVTAPSGKGDYRLVATVTPKDTTNLSKGTVVWEFTILDREDAGWLTMSVEDGKITKVTRPAADDAEAEEDITEKVLLTASADGSKTAYKVPAGAQVTVTANDAPQDMKFEMWRFSVNSMNGDTTLALYSRSMTFTLKDDFAGLTVSAMYQDAAIDSGYDILGPAAAATTAVVGSAILAYQGHMLGTELYLIYLLPSGAVIPANRIQLAMLLWQDAGNPAPVDETPYSDIDSGDTDAMQAAQWAVETGLMELPDADNAPDQFDPYAAVSNVDVIHAWKKAQKVKG